MNLRSFKILVEVCNEMNMTHAAKNMHMSQPTVSQCIKDMEQHYGVLIFERLAKRLYLTEDGKEMLAYAQHFLALDRELRERMSQSTGSRTISLGATVSIGTYMLPQLIHSFRQENPGLLIKSQIDNTAALEQMLASSKIDIGLSEGRIQSKDMIVKPFYEDELVIIASASSPLAGRTLGMERLQNSHFLIREEGSGSRRQFMAALEQANIMVEIVGEYNNTEAIINSVKKDLGLGVVSRLSIDVDATEICILDIPDLRLPRPFSLVYHKNKFMSEELNQLIDYVMRF